jgi:hypothetical protein
MSDPFKRTQRSRIKAWAFLLLIVLLALVADIASGPYRTMRAIRHALKDQDAAALSAEVDFPALRTSLKAQLDDRLVRKAGPRLQSNIIAAFGIRLAQGATDAAVDAMVTPLGLGAIIEGRREWAYAGNGFATESPSPQSVEPLQHASYRFESPSRFTATVSDADGHATVLVLTRAGLRWRLSDIQLPP